MKIVGHFKTHFVWLIAALCLLTLTALAQTSVAFIAFEAETGVLLSNASITNDATASAGAYLRFGASSPLPSGSIVWQANATKSVDQEWSAWSDDNITNGAPSPDGAIYANWSHPDMQLMSRLGDVLSSKPSYRVFAPVGENRHEFKQAHPVRSGFEDRVFKEGDETWISWATKLTQHTTATSWEMFNQFRHVNEAGLTTSGSPHGLGATKNSPNYEWSSDPNLYAGASWRYDLGIPIEVNKTVKWTLHAKWSKDSSVGYFEMFADTGTGFREVMPKKNQATLLFNSTTNASGRNAMRFGIYRDSAIANNPAEIYMAGLTVATTRELAEISAFGN